MKVNSEVDHHPNSVISPVFIVAKKECEYRMILNPKELNQYIEYYHFKMDPFKSVLKLVKPGCSFSHQSTYATHIILCQLQLKIRSKSDFKSHENSISFKLYKMEFLVRLSNSHVS